MKRSYEMDLCSGPLLSKILLFSLPLILSGVLQLLFNATDIVVVGKFAGSNAMAAVVFRLARTCLSRDITASGITMVCSRPSRRRCSPA